jgi:hypothetical protein
LAPALAELPVPDCGLLFEDPDPEPEDFVDPSSDAVAPPFAVEECEVVF